MEKSKEEIRKAAFDFIDAWINKKYAGAKELGDWTTEEVADLMNDYARQMVEKYHADLDNAMFSGLEWGRDLDTDTLEKWLTDQGLSPRNQENDKQEGK